MVVVLVLGFSQSAAFNQVLTSHQNSSWAFKTLSERQHLNEPILEIVATNPINHEAGIVLGISKAAAWDQSISETASEITETNETNLNFLTTLDNSTVIKPSLAVPSAPRTDDSNIGIYRVAEGDTPSTIASRFGVSLATLLVENELHEKSLIKTGQELRILPVDGISHTVKEGDTLAKLMEKYKLTEDQILDANDMESDEDLLVVGSTIAIPKDDLEVPKPPPPPTRIAANNTGRVALSQASPSGAFAAGAGNMIWPTTSRVITQYFWRHHNGLDISGHGQNPGPPIFASDDGFVEIAGWQQGGWGNTVVINHGNGIKTRYAHMSVVGVRAGQTVAKGQQIGLIGNTGRSTGPHLHFTIYRGGIAVDPLQYVRP